MLRASLERKEEKEKVRVALMRAALHLAAAHGFASLGLREVAREAGIAPTSFYRHFADMEELGTTLIRELAGREMRELAERALAARDGAVGVLVDAILAAVASDPELLRFVVSERTGASVQLRALLRIELTGLARTLQTIDGQSSATSLQLLAAESAVSLLFDAAGDALDRPKAGRATLREPLIWSMTALLTAARGSQP